MAQLISSHRTYPGVLASAGIFACEHVTLFLNGATDLQVVLPDVLKHLAGEKQKSREMEDRRIGKLRR